MVWVEFFWESICGGLLLDAQRLVSWVRAVQCCTEWNWAYGITLLCEVVDGKKVTWLSEGQETNLVFTSRTHRKMSVPKGGFDGELLLTGELRWSNWCGVRRVEQWAALLIFLKLRVQTFIVFVLVSLFVFLRVYLTLLFYYHHCNNICCFLLIFRICNYHYHCYY